MKDFAFFFITVVVTAAWCAMWFIVVSNEIEFPVALHAAFIVVAGANGYDFSKTIQAKVEYNKQVLLNLAKTKETKLNG
jgi:hypothetical protein